MFHFEIERSVSDRIDRDDGSKGFERAAHG